MKGKRKTTKEFIEEAKNIHGDKYDYSSVEYKNIQTKINILCSKHGMFQVSPNSHLSKKSGCPKCAGLTKKTTQQFIEEAKKIHDDKYDYSLVEYKNTHSKVKIICPEHGTFSMSPIAHLSQKQGCVKCSYIKRGNQKRKSLEDFISEAKDIHSDKYDYSLVEYSGSKTKVRIMCPKHGTFKQTPDHHINKKQGCPKCWEERRPSGVGGYCSGWFENHPEEKKTPALFYAVEMHSVRNDHFIKIGITKNSIKQRYARTGSGDKYLKKVILLAMPTTLYNAHILEQQMLKKLKDHQYFPNHKFDGQTECFKVNDVVMKQIQGTQNETK